MRGENVAHVRGLKALGQQLGVSGLSELELRAYNEVECHPKLARAARVVVAEAGVYEHESLGTLDQQAVTDQPGGVEQPSLARQHAGAAGAHRAAAEVMDRTR